MSIGVVRGPTVRLAATAAALTIGYPLLWRKRCLNWGATSAEIARTMPGDELLPSAGLVATRAVTVYASAKAIWPWLVQMGPERGGTYTYHWIEKLLGLEMHSADTVIPEFQHPQPGETHRLGEHGPSMRLEILERESALVLRSQDGAWVWAFGLYPRGEATRLVSRNRVIPPNPTPMRRLFNLYVMEPGSLIMERRMLLGIKERGEALARGIPPGRHRASTSRKADGVFDLLPGYLRPSRRSRPGAASYSARVPS
jgi:hypothetical protein